MIGSVAVAALLAAGAWSAPASPPTDPPLPVDAGETIEQRLAEFSFATFITLEFGTDPGAFTCAGPNENDEDDVITCFALTGDGRVIIAVTTSSAGTGVYDWEVVSNQMVDGDPAVTTTTSLPPPPASGDVPASNIADSSIQSYGATINRTSESMATDYVELSEGAIRAVNEYGWDAEIATLTLGVTLNPTMVIDHDTAAWVLVQAEKQHWLRGEPFRLEGATLRPSFVLVVSGTRYVSEFDLMVQVADQLIDSAAWASSARQP